MEAVQHQRILKQTEVGGFFFIVFAGSLLHFTYELSGGNMVVALFSAVNESVWEHLKLPFFPALALTVYQYARIRKTYPNLLYGKAVGIISMPAIIVAGFYAYEAVFHSSNLAYDIGLFIASVAAGQSISYRITLKHGAKAFNPAPVAVLAVAALLFFVFTYTPPELDLFRDPLTGEYGVHAHAH